MTGTENTAGQRKSVHIGIEERAYEKIVAHLIDMYSDPFAAAVKELIFVCRNEAALAGKSNESIKVVFSWSPVTRKDTVTVTVAGIGMSPDELRKAVSCMSITGEEGLPFSSISAKAPLAAANSFSIRSRKQGSPECIATVSRVGGEEERKAGKVGMHAELAEIESEEEVLPVGSTSVTFEINTNGAESALRAATTCSMLYKVFSLEEQATSIEVESDKPIQQRPASYRLFNSFNPYAFCKLSPVSFNGVSGSIYARPYKFMALMDKIEKKELIPDNIAIVSEGTVFPASGNIASAGAIEITLAQASCVVVLPRGSFPTVPSFESLVVGDWMSDLCRSVTDALCKVELGTAVAEDLSVSALLEKKSDYEGRSRYMTNIKIIPFMKRPPFSFPSGMYGCSSGAGLKWDLDSGKVVGKYGEATLDLSSFNLISELLVKPCSRLTFAEALASPLCLCFNPDMPTILGHPMRLKTGREGFGSRKGELLASSIDRCTQATEYSTRFVEEEEGIRPVGKGWDSVLIPGIFASYVSGAEQVVVAWSESMSASKIKKLLADNDILERSSTTVLMMPKGTRSNNAGKLVERLKEVYGEGKVKAVSPAQLENLSKKGQKSNGVEKLMSVVLNNAVVYKPDLTSLLNSKHIPMPSTWAEFKNRPEEYCSVICKSFGKYAKAVDAGAVIANAIAVLEPSSKNLRDKVIIIPAVNATKAVREELALSGVAPLYDSETDSAEYGSDDYSIVQKPGTSNEIMAHARLDTYKKQSKCVALISMFCFKQATAIFSFTPGADIYNRQHQNLSTGLRLIIPRAVKSLGGVKNQYVLDRNFGFMSSIDNEWRMIMGEDRPDGWLDSIEQIDDTDVFVMQNTDIVSQLTEEWLNSEEGFCQVVRRCLSWSDLISRLGVILPFPESIRRVGFGGERTNDKVIKNDSILSEFMVSLGKEAGVFGELPESMKELYKEILLRETGPEENGEEE